MKVSPLKADTTKRVVQGKGSRPRVKGWKQYRFNYGQIDWRKK
jgi:hypothetical protein